MFLKIVTAAALIMAGSATVRAADLGGDCCADLETRVAELEALSVKKGNRKLSMTISGSLSRAVYWAPGTDPVIAQNWSVPDNVRIEGVGKVTQAVRAGYVIELGIDEGVYARQTYVFIDGPAGKLSLGEQFMASHASGNTQVVVLDGAPMFYDDTRRTSIRWDSAPIAGITLAASYAPGTTADWDASARWAGTAGKLDATAVLAYRSQANGATTSVAVSGGLRENVVGLFVQGAWEHSSDTSNAAFAQGGWSHNVTGLGATTLYAEAGTSWTGSTLPTEPNMIGAGIQQSLDGANSTLYLGWRRDGFSGTDDRVVGGMGVKF